jgi:peptide/nickel transport system permease protein
VFVLYASWLGQAIRGDFGDSYIQSRPVNEILRERLPRSLELGVLTLALAVAGRSGSA